MPELLQVLERYKKDKIAIYGLGIETEKLLYKIENSYHIIGLLDSYREEGELYGKRIISMGEMVQEKCRLILVVARPGSCRAIAQRIENICRQQNIALYDVRGKNLLEEKRAIYNLNASDGITKSKLAKKINNTEVISVDLFDTLLMRQTFFATDVVELVEKKLSGYGIFVKDFVKKRLRCEKQLSQTKAPTLVEIYQAMLEGEECTISAGELAELEYQIDYELIIPRYEFRDYITSYFNKGKKVYIVSDTYYTRAQIEKMLAKCHIVCYTDILISCEYHTSKTQELYHKLLNIIGKQECLHIGDDSIADVKSAMKNGLSVCKIYSAVELLEMVGYLGIWEDIHSLSDRIKVGLFISNLFNSPFQFETRNSQLKVRQAKSLGYLFFAPIISDFVIWFAKQIEQKKIENIWFCARDGYLIQKLYQELCPKRKTTYFLTSRIAAIRAGVQDERDIQYIENMRFSGTIREQMQKRFGVSVKEERASLLDYKQEIMEKVICDRQNMQKYLSTINTVEGEIAFFDFVAKGTCQLFVSHLLSQHLKGVYFLQLEEEQMQDDNLDVIAYYRSEEKNNSAIFEDYYILETVLTAPTPSIEGFDEQGSPLYAVEERSQEDIRCFQEAQEGIFDYFRTYLHICPQKLREPNKHLSEKLLRMIHMVNIENEMFLKLNVEDAFFNRTTKMRSLL